MKEMEELTSCKTAIDNCKTSGTFAIAHLYKEEKAMDMHIHDCYEIYYSICGGKQFLIDNCFYTIAPGDLFIINQYESHKLTQIDNSRPRTYRSVGGAGFHEADLHQRDGSELLLHHRSAPFSHKLSLNKEQQKRFLYYINKITSAEGFAHDITEYAAFMELMVMLNTLFIRSAEQTAARGNRNSSRRIQGQ